VLLPLILFLASLLIMPRASKDFKIYVKFVFLTLALADSVAKDGKHIPSSLAKSHNEIKTIFGAGAKSVSNTLFVSLIDIFFLINMKVLNNQENRTLTLVL
jgi:hypothetical protein